jgi:hypothetical protein
MDFFVALSHKEIEESSADFRACQHGKLILNDSERVALVEKSKTTEDE